MSAADQQVTVARGRRPGPRTVKLARACSAITVPHGERVTLDEGGSVQIMQRLGTSVTVRTEGTRRYYRARPEGLAELTDWLAGFWTASMQSLAIEVEREQWNARKKQRKSKQ